MNPDVGVFDNTALHWELIVTLSPAYRDVFHVWDRDVDGLLHYHTDHDGPEGKGVQEASVGHLLCSQVAPERYSWWLGCRVLNMHCVTCKRFSWHHDIAECCTARLRFFVFDSLVFHNPSMAFLLSSRWSYFISQPWTLKDVFNDYTCWSVWNIFCLTSILDFVYVHLRLHRLTTPTVQSHRSLWCSAASWSPLSPLWLWCC